MHIYSPDSRTARCQPELLIELTRLSPLAVSDRSEKKSERKKKKTKVVDFDERKCNKTFIVSNIYFQCCFVCVQ